MITRKRLLALALFGLVVYVLLPFAPVGCLCAPFDPEARKYNDAARGWLRGWDGNYDWNDVSNHRAVPDSKMPHAELLLQAAASVPLTDAQAVELSGGQAAKAGKPYLVRGVGVSHGRAPLEVYSRANGDVWVVSGAVGRCPPPMQRLAVVTWLDQQPKNVYVTFSLAQ